MRTAFSPTQTASGAGTILCALSPWTSPLAVSPRCRPSFRPVSPVVLKVRGPDDDRYAVRWAGPYVLSPRLRVREPRPLQRRGGPPARDGSDSQTLMARGTNARCAGGLSVASATSLTWSFTLERATW